ncbi:MAG: trypsin-like serine protease [Deltaproteobacteria bacterium]|nr:trypsin-like serine protease [Deltaproteobacteria bacterium]MBT6436148.1 trypsin-like serine protease [Deltaproteobacteria bacterium]MBT6489355.1 trypsin-like serine protease [Deltaproteobacteria bacterium]
MSGQRAEEMKTGMKTLLVSTLIMCIVGCGSDESFDVSNYSSARKELAIIDGETIDAESHPSVGALVYRDHEGQHLFCTGTLIADDVVLTAAHCAEMIPNLRAEGKTVSFVMTGDVGSQNNMNESQFSSYEIHPNYIANTILPPERMPACNVPKDEVDERLCSDVKVCSNQPSVNMEMCIEELWFEYTEDCRHLRELSYIACENSFYFALGLKGLSDAADIALVYLAEKISNVAPSRVLQPRQSDLLKAGTPVTIVGFGQRSATPGHGESGYKVSAQSIMTEVGYGEIKVGSDPSLPQQCFGDSGGPTFLELGDNRPVVIGVTSRGYDWGDCTKGGVETRTDIFFEWLDETMREACVRGIRQRCVGDGTLIPKLELAVDSSTVLSAETLEGGCASVRASQNMMPVWVVLFWGLVLRIRKQWLPAVL